MHRARSVRTELLLSHSSSMPPAQFLPFSCHFRARVTGKSPTPRSPAVTIRVVESLQHFISTFFIVILFFPPLLRDSLPEICLLQFFELNSGLLAIRNRFHTSLNSHVTLILSLIFLGAEQHNITVLGNLLRCFMFHFK